MPANVGTTARAERCTPGPRLSHVAQEPCMGRILVLEDEGIVALALVAVLTGLGYAVIGPVDTAEGAIALALAERPELMLMDIQLKGQLDGVDAAQQIKKDLDVPCVFLTAHTDEATLARVAMIEPDAYVIKPFQARALGVTLRLVLARHQVAKARLAGERAARRVDARHRAVLDNTHDGVVCADPAGRITLFNRGAERIFGCTAHEALGQPLETLIPESLAGHHIELVRQFQARGGTPRHMGESRAVLGRRRNGSTFPAEVSISMVDVEGERTLTACVRDVTDRLALELQFVRAQKMDVVGRLAASVAHDFNNVLMVVQNNAFLLQGVQGTGKELVDEITTVSQRGSALTRQLLGFSRDEPESRQVIEVNELVTGVAPLLQRLLREDLRLEQELDGTAGCVHVDPYLVEQALMNLVANARDAMSQGGHVTIRTGSEVVAASGTEVGLRGSAWLPPGHYVRIEVSDTGCGVPAELGEQIFEAFFTTKPRGRGTGLGLSSVRAIARRVGGDVCCRTNQGPGATFVLLLPRTSPGAWSSLSAPVEVPVANGTETILVVDNDPAVLRAISGTLQLGGYSIRACATWEQALAFAGAEAQSLELLLCDSALRGCTGRELCRRVAKLRPHLPILLMTGYLSEEPELIAGAPITVLQKPIPPVALLCAVRGCLAARGTVPRTARVPGTA